MKKKIMLGISLLILMIGLCFCFLKNREYKYICLNIDLGAEEMIVDQYLEECVTNKKLDKNVITKREELLFDDDHKYYKLKPGVKYQVGDILYKDDFVYYEYPKQTSVELKLLDELEVINHGNSPLEFTKYHAYVKNNKLYATNLKTNTTEVVFDTEDVKNIAIRPICCAGEGNLIILTKEGNVYYSEKDCNYSFSFDFPFKKLNVTDIVSFKLIPIDDDDNVKNLYGVNSNGDEILLQKLN